MIDKLISLSIKNKFLVIIFTLGLIGWGVYSMLNLSIDAVPDITNNQVQIVTVTPSLAAQEVEQFITYPIEMEMANVQNVEEIRSISRYGLSVVTVVFEDHVPVLDARQLVGQQLQVARQEIPEGFGEPSLMPITTGLGEIYQYTLELKPGYENLYNTEELRTIHDWIVKRQLNGIPGIVEISSFGGYIKQYEVAVNPQVLSNYNLTLLDVNEALKKNNQNTGGSYVQKGPYAYYIRTNGLISGFEDIERIVVTTRNNIPIYVADIADVRIGSPPRFGAMTKDGKGEAVGGITLMVKGGNASQVINEVKLRIEQINKNLPQGIVIKPYLDRSVLVKKVINTVSTNLVEGGLIVILLLILLLGNFRASLIVASVIPLSMLVAFGLMKAFGITATVMSLGAIDFGLIIDATVIIVESFIFQIERQKQKLSYGELDSLVLNATKKIKNSAAFGAIIILIVYFPILALSGIEGKMFRPMALTVSFAIIGALILSFTYVPVMSSLLLTKKISEKRSIAARIMGFLYHTYKPVFNLALRYKSLVIAMAIVLFASSIIVFNNLGAEFLPDLDEGDLAMQMTIPPGSSLKESIATSTKAENVLLKNFPEVKSVVSKIGTAEVPTDPMAIEDADIMIILKPRSEWISAETREGLVDKMKEKLGVITGASFEFTQPIQLRFNELLTGAKADVVVKIYGEDLKILFDKANEAAKMISSVRGAADVKVEQIEGLPQLVIDYDRRMIARYGLNIEEINTMIRTALAGENVGVIFEGERKFDLVVRLQEEHRTNFDDFNNMYVKTPQGNQIPLREVAKIEFVDSPTQISRDNTQRRISIGINVRNRDVQSVVEDIQDKMETGMEIPYGYYITYGGKFENLQTALTRLKIVVPIALLMIFILLYFAFGKFKYAFLISLTIPLSIIGGIFALWLRGLPFSISAGVGFIALFGVAVLDGIVLINHLNELKQNGIDDIYQRLREATKNRLRPVTITSAVASLGFLPMALSTSAGAEVQRPLATVVIGGIITSTFLTMIVLPLVYYYFEKGFRIKSKLPTNIIMLLLLVISPVLLKAQGNSDTLKLSLEQAVKIATVNNLEVVNASLEIEKRKLLMQSTFDFGRTEFEFQQGQLNSDIIDYNITIRQNFGNPFENVARHKLYQSEELNARNIRALIEKQIEYRVKENYNYQQLLYAKRDLLDTLLSYFQEIMKIADIQYETGEANYLSKLNMENHYYKYNLLNQQIITESKGVQKQLQLIMYSDTFCIFNDAALQIIPFTSKFDELDQKVAQSKILQLEEMNIDLAEKKYKLEKAKLFPEIYAGYFNQKIDGMQGFSGWEAGVSIPLFAYVQHKNIKASRIDIEIAGNNKLQLQFNTLQDILSLFDIYNQLMGELNYYKNTALPNAEILLKNADLLYRNGEIGNYEYLQTLESVTETRMNYLIKIYGINQTILKIQYLTR